jgi:glutamyl-tRNA reductase
VLQKIDSDLLIIAQRSLKLSGKLQKAKIVELMAEYRDFCGEMEELAKKYQSKLSQVRKDNLVLRAITNELHQKVPTKFLDKLRALNRAPLIDKTKEALKLLDGFTQKCIMYSLEYRLEEYKI